MLETGPIASVALPVFTRDVGSCLGPDPMIRLVLYVLHAASDAARAHRFRGLRLTELDGNEFDVELWASMEDMKSTEPYWDSVLTLVEISLSVIIFSPPDVRKFDNRVFTDVVGVIHV